jgi:hypothetical protein
MRYIFLILLFSFNLCGQGYIDNIIPVGNKEIKFVNSSLTPYNVLINNYTSKVRRWNETFTVVIPSAPTITNNIGSFGGNIMTSNVSGVIDTARIINSNLLTWTQGTGLTNTTNGVPAAVLTPSGTLLNVLGYNSLGNPVYQPLSTLFTTTHTLSSSANTMTSIVNGITATAPIINSNTLTWNSTNGLLTSTVNGIAASATIPRVSQSIPLQNGVLDTRVGAIGTAGTNIYAAWNHQHPLVALTVPVLPNCAVSGSGSALVSQTITRVRATEETITWTIQVRTSNTAATTWLNITPPAITGFYLSKFINVGSYESATANVAPYWAVHPTFVWAGTTLYMRPRAANLDVYHNLILEYTLN